MKRRVFYSFHFDQDNWRVSKVRNIGAIEENAPVSDNDWEKIKKGGDTAIQRWIDGQLDGKTCTVVLIGQNTAGRKWINYEIETSWNSGKGLLGIHIHRITDRLEQPSLKGANPFDTFTMKRDNAKLSSLAKVYDPPYATSSDVYGHIKRNLENWVEEAIKIRANYG